MPNQVKNNSKPTNFQVIFNRIPNVVFKLQQVNVPTLTLAPTRLPTHGDVEVYLPGDTLVFEDWTFDFIVDEDLSNYRELYNWFRDLVDEIDLQDKVDTASLLFLDNNKVPMFSFNFEEIFPTILTDLLFVTNTDDSTLVCSASFKYSHFHITEI